ITTGSDNILIGDDVRAGLTQTGSNQLNIGNLIFGTSVGTGASLATAGKVGIGTSSPTTALSVQANAGSQGLQNWFDQNGSEAAHLIASAGLTTFETVSRGVGNSALKIYATDNSTLILGAHNSAVHVTPGPFDGSNDYSFQGGGTLGISVY